MDSKSFVTISREECGIVYKQIIDNSNKKWSSAKILAENGDFGGAASFCIISIEELIKALIIFLDSKGFEFRRIKGSNSLFEQHRIRFVLTYLMFGISIFGEELMRFVSKVHENPQEIKKLNDLMKFDKEKFDKLINSYLLRKFVLMKQELKWFSEIELFRQKGFYCDFSDELETPLSISQTDYEGLFRRLKSVKKVIHKMVIMFNSNEVEVVQKIEQIRIGIKKDKGYESLKQMLGKVKGREANPFNLIINAFE